MRGDGIEGRIASSSIGEEVEEEDRESSDVGTEGESGKPFETEDKEKTRRREAVLLEMEQQERMATSFGVVDVARADLVEGVTWRDERGCNRELRGEVEEVDSCLKEEVKGVLKEGKEGERT